MDWERSGDRSITLIANDIHYGKEDRKQPISTRKSVRGVFERDLQGRDLEEGSILQTV